MMTLLAEDYVHVYAKYMTPHHMQFEAYHVTAEGRTSDMLLSLALKEGRLLSARAYVRPTLYRDMSNPRRYLVIKDRLNNIMEQVTRAAVMEVRYKRSSLGRAAEPLKSFADSIAQDANTKMEVTRQMAHRMYANNEYFSRDIYDGVSNMATAANMKASQWMANLKNCVRTRSEEMYRKMTIWKNNTVMKIRQYSDLMESAMEDYKVQLINLRVDFDHNQTCRPI